eukprot:TRINITY_DN12029_c0_g1_i1.p1 TRINITY_DN12029_c0_g1~~TRINITY_DN12029_c0_g1_i1.p1  ORF type:complete len:164 (-),score=53.71 TRINITY_DN12029_c0_g1_i1:32-523(-)
MLKIKDIPFELDINEMGQKIAEKVFNTTGKPSNSSRYDRIYWRSESTQNSSAVGQNSNIDQNLNERWKKINNEIRIVKERILKIEEMEYSNLETNKEEWENKRREREDFWCKNLIEEEKVFGEQDNLKVGEVEIIGDKEVWRGEKVNIVFVSDHFGLSATLNL